MLVWLRFYYGYQSECSQLSYWRGGGGRAFFVLIDTIVPGQ